MSERSTPLFRVRTVAAGMVVAAVALLATASPASAHDELLSSSPAFGEQLPAAPSEVTLTFSADVLDVGAAIVIADADGRDWAAGDPVVVEDSVRVPVQPDMPDAGYEVRWRAVAADGHPITGIVHFTVGNTESLVRKPGVGTEPVAGDDVGEPAAHPQTAEQDQGPMRTVLVGAAGAAIAVAIFTVISFLRRRASAVGTDDSSS